MITTIKIMNIHHLQKFLVSLFSSVPQAVVTSCPPPLQRLFSCPGLLPLRPSSVTSQFFVTSISSICLLSSLFIIVSFVQVFILYGSYCDTLQVINNLHSDNVSSKQIGPLFIFIFLFLRCFLIASGWSIWHSGLLLCSDPL